MLKQILAVIVDGFVFSPFIIISAMTKLRSHESTQSQQGWTLAWSLGSYVLPYFLVFTERNIIKDRQRRVLYKRILSLMCYISAIGGMTVVGRMIKDYGICEEIG